jgi:hypothetical protein
MRIEFDNVLGEVRFVGDDPEKFPRFATAMTEMLYEALKAKYPLNDFLVHVAGYPPYVRVTFQLTTEP